MTDIIIMPVFEGVKRVIGLCLYPVAYALRHYIRTDEVMIEHKQAAACGAVCWRPRAGWGALWAILDDSINLEGRMIYARDIDYHNSGKRSSLVEKLPEGAFKEFARSWHWSAVRNSCINLTWIMSPGDMVSEAVKWGEKPRNFYAVRTYPKGKTRHYFQFYPWGDVRFKVGFLSNGRFEIALREKKP